MATLDLWMEGDWGADPIAWHMPDVSFDMLRYHYDDRYASLINDHIQNALTYLSRELSEIAMLTPPTEENDWTHCE